MEFKEQIQRILENVPKVYEAGSSSIKNEVANALKGSASGEAVALKDVSPIEHNLGVRVESKNKINAPDKTVSGTTAWYAEKLGSYTLPNGTYTISCDIEKSASAVPCLKLQRLKDGSDFKEHTVISNGKMTTSFTVDDSFGGGIIIFLYSNLSGNAVETSCTYSNIQVEPGTTATPYTPYIEDTTAARIGAQGKNLFDVSKIITSSTVINNGDGTILVKDNGGQATNRTFKELCPELKAGDTFTLSFRTTNAVMDSKVGGYIYIAGSYNEILSSGSTYTATQEILDGGVFLYKAHYSYQEQVEEGIVSEIQVEIGTTATEYEPYKEPIEYSQGEDIKSIYPTTTIRTDTVGTVLTVEYNIDLNKAFAELYQAIISLGGNV
ncbi:MAG: hypothetical protein U0M60_03325 [Clostridia bacterium]|nr:hypothetical protein [Clostridia bacterium]